MNLCLSCLLSVYITKISKDSSSGLHLASFKLTTNINQNIDYRQTSPINKNQNCYSNCNLTKNPDIKSMNLIQKCRLGKKKKICVFTVLRPTLIFSPTLNIFMALSVQNELNTLFLLSNVVFDV